MPIPAEILYLTENEVQQTLSVAEAVFLAEKGIKADANGDVVGNKFYMPVNQDGFIKPFSGYMDGEEWAFVKTFSYFPGNPDRFHRSTTSSMVILFDVETGLPVCIMEAGWVTGLKTGASTAVTASYLSNPNSSTLTVFGVGSLGCMHTRAIAQRFTLKKVYVIDILPDIAEARAKELEAELGISVEAVLLEDREKAVRSADIIVTVTTGDQPLFQYDWLKPGAFVARLGSYQEVALDVITRADKFLVDNWHYVSPRIPEIIRLVEGGQFGIDNVYAEWPEIVGRKKPGRESTSEVIVYIALGIWGEYAAILPEIYRKAMSLGLGHKLPCSHT
jgi:ornithine cyclodeaminase/alanine dehydrogenase-like protein (mu-crystallin family)